VSHGWIVWIVARGPGIVSRSDVNRWPASHRGRRLESGRRVPRSSPAHRVLLDHVRDVPGLALIDAAALVEARAVLVGERGARYVHGEAPVCSPSSDVRRASRMVSCSARSLLM
jgi:hypothetical protein